MKKYYVYLVCFFIFKVHDETKELLKLIYKQLDITDKNKNTLIKISVEFRRRVTWMKNNDAEANDIENTIRILIDNIIKKKIISEFRYDKTDVMINLKDTQAEINKLKLTGDIEEEFFFAKVKFHFIKKFDKDFVSKTSYIIIIFFKSTSLKYLMKEKIMGFIHFHNNIVHYNDYDFLKNFHHRFYDNQLNTYFLIFKL